MKSVLIPKDNPHWPRHARGRLLTRLNCGHLVYDQPEVCPICKQRAKDTALPAEPATRGRAKLFKD